MNKLFWQTANRLAQGGYIQEKYIALYAKTMETLLAICVNFISALLIGCLFEMQWHCLLFLAAFIPLRSYAGGYHARGYVSCYLTSCIMLAIMLWMEKHLLLEGHMTVAVWQLFLVAIPVIFLFAPLADENKPLSEKEEQIFRRRARMILLVEAALVPVLAGLKTDYGYSVMLAIIVSALMLVMYKSREYIQSCISADKGA